LTVSRKCFFLSFFLINLLILAIAPIASASTSMNRIAGYDRYQTAVAISQSGWPDGAGVAILAYGENFPDALSAGPLAHKYDAPILLTGTHNLNEDTAQELTRLKVKKVIIVGGSAVVSKTVETQLSSLSITSVRLAGQDCYETSLKVAQDVGISKGVFVTTGLDFPDALSIAPIAATKAMPIILVPRDEVTPEQKTFLSKSEIPNTYIVNGYSEISDNVINQFPNYEVITGFDPYERNINLIKRFASDLNLDTVYLATGEFFPDALAASALAQKGNNALILLKRDTIPYSTQSYIRSNLISEFNILGGTSVISAVTETTLRELPAQIKSVKNINDSVKEKQKYDPPKTVTVTKSDGLEVEVPVTWTLSSVNTLHAGTYKFEGQIKGYSDHVYLNLTIDAIVSKINPISAEIILGGSYSLPDTVTATMSDGTSNSSYPVTWSSTIVPINKAGTYTFKGKVEGLTQAATLTLKVSEDAKIDFPDEELREVIRLKLGKSRYATIYRSDVIKITTLSARNSDIYDLTGLEYLTNLKTLDLGNNSLTNITALSKLTNIRTLKLNNTELKSITTLKSLTSLTYLDLSDNYIVDFTPLKTFTSLTTLYLKYNEPFDYIENYTPDYSPVRAYYKNLDHKDFSL